jgi:hypothetical protein
MMRRSFFTLFMTILFFGSFAVAKWVDPEAEAQRNHRVKAWQGIDFTFTGFSSSTGVSTITYHSAINDFFEWDAGTGIDTNGWVLTGGGRYFIYNWPHTTCFFMFPCHGQVSAGANLTYYNGGRKSFENNGVETRYDQGSSVSAWPTIAFRSIYRDFFSLSLDVGYRIMVQKPSIARGYGPALPSAVEDMEKANKDGLGASVSLGIVF